MFAVLLRKMTRLLKKFIKNLEIQKIMLTFAVPSINETGV